MKKFTLFSLIIGVLFSMSTFAQSVPNGDFEEWENGLFGFETPVKWWSIGGLTGHQDIQKVSPGQSGDYAAQLTPVDVPGLGVHAPILTSMAFSVPQKFGQLSIYAKGTSVNNDTLSVVSFMTKNGSIIGACGGFTSGVIDTFTRFDFDYTYEGNESPDSCQVVIFLGRSDGTANIGSEFTVDNLSLSGVAGIGNVESACNAVGNPYPNPASLSLNIPFELKEPTEVSLNVYNSQGSLVLSQEARGFSAGSNEVSIDVGNIGAGIYFMTLSSDWNSVETRTFVVK